MKLKLSKQNILFLIIILLLLIPQTRQPIQVVLHKGLSYINQSSMIDQDDREQVAYANWQLISDANTHLNFKNTKDKVVFVNFWATWCPPCIAEMPSLQELYNDYNEKVIFLFITNDELEKVKEFKSKRNFNFEVFNSINDIPEVLRTNSIPRTFIINKKGQIVVDESGAINWNSETVRRQLNQLIAE